MYIFTYMNILGISLPAMLECKDSWEWIHQNWRESYMIGIICRDADTPQSEIVYSGLTGLHIELLFWGYSHWRFQLLQKWKERKEIKDLNGLKH